MKENVYSCDFAEFDVSEYPLIVVTLNNVDPNHDQIRDYVHLQNKVVDEREGQFAIVIDGAGLDWINGSARILLKNLITQFERQNFDRHLGVFFIARTVFHKIALKGFNRVNKPLVKQIIFQSKDEAIKEALAKLDSMS